MPATPSQTPKEAIGHHDAHKSSSAAHPLENAASQPSEETPTQFIKFDERHGGFKIADHLIHLPASSVSSPVATKMDIDEPQEVIFLPSTNSILL